MEEIQFLPEKNETQESMSLFCRQVYDRMRSEHPDLMERHLHIIEDTDPYGRLYGATALHCIMDVIDSRARTEAARQASGLFPDENDHRKLA